MQTNSATRVLGACGGYRLGIGKGEGLGLGGRAKRTCTKPTERRTGPGVSVRLFPCLCDHSCRTCSAVCWRLRRSPGTRGSYVVARHTADSAASNSKIFIFLSLVARRDHRDTETTERRHQVQSCVPWALCMSP